MVNRMVNRLLTPAVAVVALAALAACEKPAPGATVFSGTNSAHREAICWSFDADTEFDPTSDCQIQLESTEGFNERLLDDIAVISTAPGETVGMSVAPGVAEDGWLVTINGRPLTREPITEKYFRFTMPPQPLSDGDAQLVIQALTTGGDAVRGSWIFGLSAD